MNHIVHNKYLAFCYDRLSEITGSIITFGFNFGDYDTHIIDAINKASQFNENRDSKLFSIYIGVFSESDYEHINTIKSKV